MTPRVPGRTLHQMGALIWRCRLHTRHWRDQSLEALVPLSVGGFEANGRAGMRMAGKVKRVEFSVVQGIKGPAAENVTRVTLTSGGADG